MAGIKPPLNLVQCRRCGQMGHYQSQCKTPRIQAYFFTDYNDEDFQDDNSNNKFDSMFVATFDEDLP